VSESRKYHARSVHGGSEFPYDVIDTGDESRVVLGSIPGTVIIGVVEAMNAAYEQGMADASASAGHPALPSSHDQ
jgi:hypothetical protein